MKESDEPQKKDDGEIVPTVVAIGTRTLAPARPEERPLRIVAAEFAGRGSRATIDIPDRYCDDRVPRETERS